MLWDREILARISTARNHKRLTLKKLKIWSDGSCPMKLKPMLSDGAALDDVPLLDADPQPSVQFPPWVMIAAGFLVSLIASILLLHFSERVSTFYAWLIIVFAIGAVCFGTSLWAENAKLRGVARAIAVIAAGTCTVSLAGFWLFFF
jgi:uncharacterized membrane protein